MKCGFDLSSYLSRVSEEVGRVLDELVPADGFPSSVFAAMRYSLLAGGKRLRPALCLGGCEAVGGDRKRALRAAAGIEMIHSYSLIHDDLPAMDNDDWRRGQPTCHKKFGQALAILAGDGLLTESFAAIAGDPLLTDAEKARVIWEVAKAAGVCGMVGGQVMDMEKEGREFSEADVRYIHTHKTAAMIAMSASVGGIIGGGNENEISALRAYGEDLGLAFQIVDDVLNVTGGQDLGKDAGTDAARGKATWPALFGVEESIARARSLCAEGARRLDIFGERGQALREISRYVHERTR